MNNRKDRPHSMKTLLRYFLVCALLAINLFCVQAAHAATFTVNKLEDTNDGTCDADCSLREAIVAASWTLGADFITFDATVFNRPQTITLNRGLESVAHGITITGPTGGLTLAGVMDSLTERFDLFTVNQGQNVEFNG